MFCIARGTFIVVAALAMASAAFAAGLKEDIIALDRASIPALSILNRDEPQLARRSMDTLTHRWNAFKVQYASTRPGDRLWQAEFKRIDDLMADANRIVQNGKDKAAAREALKNVRRGFVVIREQAKVPCYLDHLTRFHDVMEEMFLLVRDKTPELLTSADIEKIRAAFATADRLWSVAAEAKVDPEFGLDSARQAELSTSIAKESQALATLGRALGGTDKEALIKAVQGIRSPFGATLSIFGDWKGLKE